MSPLQEAVRLQMRLRGFAHKTVEGYIHAMEQLWGFYRRPLETLDCAAVQRFLDEIIRVRQLAWATVNVYFSAYRFLYEQVLRHCFATHLMEDGVDIYTIRRWMGHTSLVTTGRYMHVTREHLAKIKSPLDSLYEEV